MARELDAWQRRDVPIGGTTPQEFIRNPQRRLRYFIERFILEEREEKILSVLDVACNAGIEAFRLHREGYKTRYVGIDANRKAVALAHKQFSFLGRYYFLAGDALHLPFQDGEFDCVLVKDLLEHLDGYREALTEFARVTRRWLIIGLFIPLGGKDRIVRHPDGYYMNRYGKRAFLETLRELGMSVSIKTIWRFWAREQVIIAAK
ncbi:MAG: class I SAM-dependent methyltransferase [Planctomycetes bacterium]|nr:class I SAM-dependent methyltransferase [Planctomycetota bacterium]